MFFQWGMSVCKSPQVSRIVLSISADLNNGVVEIVYIHPPISKSPNPLSKPLETVSTSLIPIGITTALKFLRYLGSLEKVLGLFSFFTFFKILLCG